jgi:hypothetical protein
MPYFLDAFMGPTVGIATNITKPPLTCDFKHLHYSYALGFRSTLAQSSISRLFSLSAIRSRSIRMSEHLGVLYSALDKVQSG